MPVKRTPLPILRISPSPTGPEHGDLPHVLLVLDGFPRVLGGGERIVLRMAQLLPRYGYRASILTFSVAPHGEFDPHNAPCPTYLLPLTKTYDIQALRGAIAFRRFLKEERVVLVQTFFESSDLWAGTLTRLFSNAKLVWSRRDMGILRGAKHTMAYRLLRFFPHAVFAVSEQVRSHVLQTDRIAPGRVHTIHNGLELQEALPHSENIRNALRHVTCVGNIRRVKGHDLLLEAAALVLKRFPDVQFTIAGEVLDQEYYKSLLQRREALGIAERFCFLGKLDNLPGHLVTADMFVLPSRSEGFSNALIEAMAAGLPCVATAVGGNAEALQNGVNGLLVAPEDAEALAAALCRLLASPDEAQCFGTAAKEAVLSHFTADAMMRAITSRYAALLSA